ncbi:MAG: acyl-CoA thioesterase [Rhodospirillum sp.]|nr:acyl-CoA thioesterase [Rhodospirillum sp.]MCF8490898.1 acyl-CoA thioesterase [Rhodospirillum sp.]MCF8499924.1 acyl-CoA thioesterase [Rhodospirillum sp.]
MDREGTSGEQSPTRYALTFEIDARDIDFMGHANNASYIRWVQEAVIAHWRRVAPSEAVASYLWVALKHEITYRNPGFLDDWVDVISRFERFKGARAFHRTVIKRGEEILAEARSVWCCLDAHTHRPTRIARRIAVLFVPGSPAGEAQG